MITKSHICAQFVILFLLKKLALKHISYCDFNCFQKGNLKVHTGSVHENKITYKCSICDYICSQKCYLKMHTESVHDYYKLQKCSICDFNYSQKGNLKAHICQFMKTKSHICAKFAILFLLKKLALLHIWNQCLGTKNM